LTKDFTRLVSIAFLIAVPIAWYGMQQWLQSFAYKVNVGVWVFLIAGATTLLVAWLTVSYQSIRATMINPVESLRSE
jgi:putative ABC transport system permease protein